MIYKLTPTCKDYLWGGEQLINAYGKAPVCHPMAESWELSLHPDGMTRVEDGRTLTEALTKQDYGTNCDAFPFFPMLVKLIDAEQNLSVQVHPSDAFALANESSFGKTEMWYIMGAKPGARIYLGFCRDVTPEEYQRAIRENTLTELLNVYEVRAGECYFIPAGTIHAIGAGCLICEIQQNSNLTYRVYDYGRRDKDGRERPLHVEKALRVTTTQKHENKVLRLPSESGEILGMSRYFQTSLLPVEGSVTQTADCASFQCCICLGGEGRIGDKDVRAGESVLISAGHGEFTLEGSMTVLMTQVRKYYVGIDLGGTFIKGGIVDDLGNILLHDQRPTEREGGSSRVSENIAALALDLLARAGLSPTDVEGIGIGVPGTIDSEAGVVVYSNNLGWKEFSIAETVTTMTGLRVKIANDANVAMLGEFKFGAAKGERNAVLLTLGTGVGGGIVANGALVEGNRSAGAELGHTVIAMGGHPCSCGRRGCLEAYASATALIRDTKEAMKAHPESRMWELGSPDAVDGKTAFDFKDCDPAAREVVDNYLSALSEGIVNVANMLRPDVVLLGGGVCAQGKDLTDPLQALLDKQIFGGAMTPPVKIRIAELGNRAGILGAAALFM